MAYQQVGIKSSKASPPCISQESKLYFNSYTNGKHSGFDIFEKRENKNQKMAIRQTYPNWSYVNRSFAISA